jgi:hypothetical protein
MNFLKRYACSVPEWSFLTSHARALVYIARGRPSQSLERQVRCPLRCALARRPACSVTGGMRRQPASQRHHADE